MNNLNKIALAALISVASVSGAAAADLITEPAVSTGETMPVYNDPGFDWNGFYAGVFGSVQSTPTGWAYGPGVVVGANAQLDYYLLGAELGFSGITDGTTGRTYAQALARAGVVLTDDFVAYGAAGYGVDTSAAPDQHALVGGGLEFAVTEDISMKTQYLYGIPATAASDPMNQFTIGANFHF